MIGPGEHGEQLPGAPHGDVHRASGFGLVAVLSISTLKRRAADLAWRDSSVYAPLEMRLAKVWSPASGEVGGEAEELHVGEAGFEAEGER